MIYTLQHPSVHEGRVEFVRDAESILVSFDWPLDLDSDEWSHIAIRVPSKAFELAIRELVSDGEAQLIGSKESRLSLRRRGQADIAIDISIPPHSGQSRYDNKILPGAYDEIIEYCSRS